MKIFIFLILIFFSISLRAQNTMFFMDRLPQKISYNPAFIPEANFYLSLPVIGGAKAHVYNTGFTQNELETFVDNINNPAYNPDDFINSIGDYNHLLAEASVNLFSIGFKLKDKGYLSFDISINDVTVNDASSQIVYFFGEPEDIPMSDFPIVIDKFDLLTNTYIGFKVNYSRRISENLTLGICPQINFNQVGLKSSDMEAKLNISNANENEIVYETNFSGNIVAGLPVEINPDAIDDGKFDMDKDLLPEGWEEDLTVGDVLRNRSFLLNIGANYEIEKWNLYASILNLGYSKWKVNGYNLNGINEDVYVEEDQKIKIGIPTKIYLGVNRQFSKKWNYGMVFNNTFYSTGSNASATLSLNGNVGKMLSTSVSYTAGYMYNNLGVGFRLRFLPGTDLYFVTDNVIQLFGYRDAHRLSFALGINIFVGADKETINENLID